VTPRKHLPKRSFHKSERIRLQGEFAQIYAARRMAADQRMSVYVIDNQLVYSRLGLSVGRIVGNAVARNRIRRRIKEAFRKNKGLLPVGVDIVCVVRPGEPGSEQDYFESLSRLVVRALGRPARLPRADTP